ncbi:MAG: hypothetical protein MAG431_02144 [Chloroflexi bacterium]|nr:hypothetical protein [Chloroflexota bacterium]
MNSDRGNWYLLTAIVLGLSMGLFYAWSISPAGLEESHPHILRSDYKDVYRAMIASAYEANGDLARARSRLALLKEKDEAIVLAAQAQRILAEGGDYQEARALADLSSALLGNVPAADPSTPTEILPTSTPTPQPSPTGTASPSPLPPTAITTTPGETPPTATSTPTATRTPTPLPTFTPTLTPIAPFILENHGSICDRDSEALRIEIYATNKKGEGVPGVEVLVKWGETEQENFFTGLKPELGFGYADFEMIPDVVYKVEIPQSGITVEEIEAQTCSDEEGEYWGGWQIFITQPD